MRRLSSILIRLRVFLFTFGCCSCFADDPAAGNPFNLRTRQPSVNLTGLGNVSFPITCGQRETQQYFNQAIAQLHAFDSVQAEKSFNFASRLEPDCAMAWWGLTVTSLENPKLAMEFARRADNLKNRVSFRERRWIEILVEYVDQDRDEKSRRLKFLTALDRLATEFPDDVEAKAFLVRQFLNNRDAGFPIQFRSAVEALIAQVEWAVPEHPISCYTLRLWGTEQPSRALGAAKQVRQILFASPPALTAAGLVYSQSGQMEQAIDCFEASAVAIHKQMINDRVWFGDVSGSVENQIQLAIHFSRMGRVHEAITLAGQLIKIPNLDPARVAAPPFESSTMLLHMLASMPQQSLSTAEAGQKLLLELLLEFHLWDQVIAVDESNYLQSTNPEITAHRIYAIAVAQFGRKNVNGFRQQRGKLQTLAERFQPFDDNQQYSRNLRQLVETYCEELNVCEQILVGGRPSDVIAASTRIPPQRKVVLFQEIGKHEMAVSLAEDLVRARPQNFGAMSNYAGSLRLAGRDNDAAEQFKVLSSRFQNADANLPIVQQLTKQCGHLSANDPPRSSGAKATQIRLSAESFSLQDRHGKAVSLEEFRGKPVLFVFYLGAGCPHCIEQLRSLAPLKEGFERAGIAVVAVSTDSVEGLVDTFKVTGAADAIPFQLLSDQAETAFRAYGAFDCLKQKPLHGSFLVDAHGGIIWQNVSPEPFMATRLLLSEAIRVLSLGDELPFELVRSSP